MKDNDTLFGVAQVIELAKPENVNFCCWPQVQFDDATDTYDSFDMRMNVKNLTSFGVLIEDATGRVVSILPLEYDDMLQVSNSSIPAPKGKPQ